MDSLITNTYSLEIVPPTLALTEQTVSASIGYCVYYNETDQTWYPAAGKVPTGVYAGNGVIVLSGLVTGLYTGLTPGMPYFMSNNSGSILPIDYGSGGLQTAYSYIKIGYAVSSTDLLVSLNTEGLYTSVVAPLQTGIICGGTKGVMLNTLNVIDYIQISSIGNAIDFGDLRTKIYSTSACSNGSNNRALTFGGNYSSTIYNIIDYIDIIIGKSSTSFGQLTSKNTQATGFSSHINNRGISACGYNGSIALNIIDYVTISTPGNASSFGESILARISLSGCSNGTDNRGIIWGGMYSGTRYNTIDYITISTLGNSVIFGEDTQAIGSIACTSNLNNNRGIRGGGEIGDYYNTISYITISTFANAASFGELTLTKAMLSATSNGTNERGIFAGGGNYATNESANIIDYITISTTGNATDFGDLTIGRYYPSATSNA